MTNHHQENTQNLMNRLPAVFATILLAFGLTQLTACSKDAPAPATTPVAGDARTKAQGNKREFIIAGNLSGTKIASKIKDGAKVKLYVDDGASDKQKPPPTATTVMKDGRFTLSVAVDQPTTGYMTIDGLGDHPRMIPNLIVEPGTFELKYTEGGEIAVSGGDYNRAIYGFHFLPQYIYAANNDREAGEEAFKNVDPMDENVVLAAEEKARPAYLALVKINVDYWRSLKKKDDRPLTRLFLTYLNAPESQTEQLAILDDLETELGPHPLIVRSRESLAEIEKSQKIRKLLDVGGRYKDVVVSDADGTPHRLSEVLARNELVMLDFWASWCGPCREEFPHLEKVYKEFHSRGFKIYAVSVDDDRDAWLKALKEERAKGEIPWINLLDQGPDSPSASLYGVSALPDNLLIAKDGTIVGRDMHQWDIIERVVRAKLDASGSPRH